MKDIVNVVVTCTKNKRVPVATSRQMRALPIASMRERIAEWRLRMSCPKSERVTVEDLYAGDHWSIVRGLQSRHFEVDVWVCSAGYGLVHFTDAIAPYAATFSSKHPDSVTRQLSDLTVAEAPAEWWQGINRLNSHKSQRPRSLKGLAAEFPKRSMLVVASENYLKAISGDLQEAVAELTDPDLLSIVSAGTKSLNGLSEYLLPCDARFQAMVSGARRSLNTRLASMIVSESRTAPRRSSLTKRLQKLLSQQPELPVYDRSPMTDSEVRQYILAAFRREADPRHTPLLRKLRAGGNACEQSRFRRLFEEISEETHG